MDRSSRFQGCLLGLAIGDALGMPFEGMEADAIEWRIQGALDFMPGAGRAGQWTDDTQMSLCVVESLLEAGRVDGAHIASKFLEWYRRGDARGMGDTTREALARMDAGAPWNEAGVRGDGAARNGAAMRIAPLGLWHSRDVEGLLQHVETATISTHNNAEAVRGACAVAFAVARAAAGELDPAGIVNETCDTIGPCRTAMKLREVQRMRDERVDWRSALARVGTGRHVVETVGAAFFCLLTWPESYERGVEAAVRAGGDTDTTAAVAGALLGAHLGMPAIPERWVERVEDAPRIAELARKLCGSVFGE